uniref:HYDIN protein n=1 Tax=Hucho hucho TaxID=62062 RepID=A0A4W5R0T9_9TELE
ADICGPVLALCEVKEGPTYEIKLKGEPSLVTYSLDRTEIDFGLQLFDHLAKVKIILRNTGKVGFEFSALLGDHSAWTSPGHP